MASNSRQKAIVHQILKEHKPKPLTKKRISKLLPKDFSTAKDPGSLGILSRILYVDQKLKGGTSQFVRIKRGRQILWTCR